MYHHLIGMFTDGNAAEDPQTFRIDHEHSSACPIGYIKLGAVAATDHVIGPAAELSRSYLATLEIDSRDGPCVDIQRIKRMICRINKYATLERVCFGRCTFLVPFGRGRLFRTDTFQLIIF